MKAREDQQPAAAGTELLPCPLCGSTDLFLRDIAGWELDCRGCELSLVLADDPSRGGLVKRWNTRTPADVRERARRVVQNLVLQVTPEQLDWARLVLFSGPDYDPDRKGQGVLKQLADVIAAEFTSSDTLRDSQSHDPNTHSEQESQ